MRDYSNLTEELNYILNKYNFTKFSKDDLNTLRQIGLYLNLVVKVHYYEESTGCWKPIRQGRLIGIDPIPPTKYLPTSQVELSFKYNTGIERLDLHRYKVDWFINSLY